jgi:hypothetical protein
MQVEHCSGRVCGKAALAEEAKKHEGERIHEYEN